MAEWVRFDDRLGDADVVHSSRLPVQSWLPWVVDADDLLVPLRIGRHFALGAASRGEPLLPGAGAIARREEAMAFLYASTRCARILFRTGQAREAFAQHLVRRGLPSALIGQLSDKSEVVYPAVPAVPQIDRAQHPVTVLYMGRTWQDKGALVAVATFAHLRARHGDGVRLVYVGPCPDAVADRLAGAGVQHHLTLPRAQYLEQLRHADIFMSPTAFESFGMGLVEAAAAGLAIVCSRGPGMEHIDELFSAGEHALFVANDAAQEHRVAGYTEAVSALIDDAVLLRRLAVNNRTLTTTGKLSVRERDRRLSAAYARAMALGPTSNGIGDTSPAESTRPVAEWTEEVCRWAGQYCTARISGRVVVRDPAIAGFAHQAG
ncbi:glycosyltransferase family 4 protein [Mycolicibacterium fluoranthenivorans]|uniref:glycosyltransferase family 4 protein n=1 Tax=Mycolicibacterium fluoranthenivorans TaxID=258505 RepID=UPI0014800E51|nr:glycosyltransferase family 4 protein [Mycolicibacterium fluoranthenivorans]